MGGAGRIAFGPGRSTTPQGAAKRRPSVSRPPPALPAPAPCARCPPGAPRGRAGSSRRGSTRGSRWRPSRRTGGRSRPASAASASGGRPPRSIGFVRRKRLLDWTVLAVAERVLALQDRMDLARAFVDDRGARITQEALDRVLGRIPVSAVNLDGVVGGIEGRVRGVLLGHRNVACVPKALVLHPRAFEIEEAADLVVTRHPGAHLLYQCVAPDLVTERLALASAFDRRVR